MQRHVRNALVAAGLLVIATAATPSYAMSGGPSSPTSADGEAIFRGVYFGEGQVAELAYGMAWATPESTAAADRVVESIRETSPQFLPTFAAAMTSGDRLRISSGLADGKKQLQATAEQVGATTPMAPLGSVIYTSNLIIFMDSGTVWLPPAEDGQLAEEQMVDRIAEGLRQ